MSDTAPKVKICGITNLADAELAVELGAWAIGMIFYDGSPRKCSLDEAQRITAALQRKVELCGVFVNDPLDRVVKTSEDLGLTIVQLHGDEGPAFCGEVPRRTGARVIKAAQVAGPGDVRDLGRYHVDFHLLDARARTPEKPGAERRHGETFDWALLAGRRSKVPLILSGGLHAGNVAEAIDRTRPFAVDSASGTERAPGKKDEARMRALFAAVGADRIRRRKRPRVSTIEHRYGQYGGQFVPETLMPALAELEQAWLQTRADPTYGAELDGLLRDFGGRPTPLYRARTAVAESRARDLPKARGPQPHGLAQAQQRRCRARPAGRRPAPGSFRERRRCGRIRGRSPSRHR